MSFKSGFPQLLFWDIVWPWAKCHPNWMSFGHFGNKTHTLRQSNIAGWKMGAPHWVDVFPIKNMGIFQPAMWSFTRPGIWNCHPNFDPIISRHKTRNLHSYFGALEWALDVSNGFIYHPNDGKHTTGSNTGYNHSRSRILKGLQVGLSGKCWDGGPLIIIIYTLLVGIYWGPISPLKGLRGRLKQLGYHHFAYENPSVMLRDKIHNSFQSESLNPKKPFIYHCQNLPFLIWSLVLWVHDFFWGGVLGRLVIF